MSIQPVSRAAHRAVRISCFAILLLAFSLLVVFQAVAHASGDTVFGLRADSWTAIGTVILAIFTIALAVGTIILVLVTKQGLEDQQDSTQISLQIAQKNADAVVNALRLERAWLLFDKWENYVEDNGDAIFVMILKNAGRVPAAALRLHSEVRPIPTENGRNTSFTFNDEKVPTENRLIGSNDTTKSKRMRIEKQWADRFISGELHVAAWFRCEYATYPGLPINAHTEFSTVLKFVKFSDKSEENKRVFFTEGHISNELQNSHS